LNSVLSFDKPKKVRTTEEHNRAFASNAEAAGTYVPNMSKKDKLRWKAKKIGGPDKRIEIRKTIEGFDPTLKSQLFGNPATPQTPKTNCYAQILMIVRPDGSVIMSSNGRMAFDSATWSELQLAKNEAFMELMKDEIRETRPEARWEDDQ
jgi:hypothetical protein